MQLRDYQEDEIRKVRGAFARGKKRVLAVLPCGAGKTVLFAYMSARNVHMSQNNHVLFLVHRKELVDQTVGTFRRFGLEDSRIQVAMVQSLTRHVDIMEKPSLIVTDEAHHIVSATYMRIMDRFPDVPVVGLTATPCRMDGEGLGKVFDDMEVGVSAKWLIENGYLARYDYYAPRINLADASYVTKGSDYDTQDAAKKLDEAGIYGDVMKYFDPERKTIVYAPSLDLSRKMADTINAMYPGIARHFDGDTPAKERDEIVEGFRKGTIRCLCNRDLIGEGFDVPDCDCCMLLRPTKSVALYIQQSMRCMRPNRDKRALIYDFVGNCYRHGMPDDDRTWSLTGKTKCRNEASVPDVTCRTCTHCFRVYAGTGHICPYCGYDNGKTPKEIAQEKEAELAKITELEKKARKRKMKYEEYMCRSYQDFLALAEKRGYDKGWAYIRAHRRGYV